MDSSAVNALTFMALVAFLGAISPGPDFVIVTKNSLKFSRRAGLFTALGVSLAVLIHITYCLLGIGIFIAESILLFNFIKYSGAAYLIFMGIKALSAKQTHGLALDYEREKQDISPLKALKAGFLTNALNPKATLFFLSVFSQVVNKDTSVKMQLAYALEIWLIVLGWFCFLSYLLSHQFLRAKIYGFHYYIDKGLGCLLIGFGLKVAMI